MGSFWSQPSYTVPDPVNVDEVLNIKPGEARRNILNNLQQYGFLIVRETEEGTSTARDCRDAVGEFFDQSDEYKKQYILPPSSDPLLPLKKNRGYIQQNHKEYLKMRLIDEKEAYPSVPEGLFEKYKASMDRMHSIVRATLDHIAHGPFEDEDEDGDDGKEERRWIRSKTMDTIQDFIVPGSSVSVIRYHAFDKEDPQLHCPCDEHYDTGVLTCILLSEVPGLQVQDRQTSEWIPVEEVGRPGDFVIIMGRKIEVLTEARSGLTPTFHRVQLREDVVRHSILFFYDIQTGPEK